VWKLRIIVTQNPGRFARGLFHEYPRYVFTNESEDILRLCGETPDQLGVAWRFSRPNAISVARREAPARLDEVVGPTY
jgi:hypothetical protein